MKLDFRARTQISRPGQEIPASMGLGSRYRPSGERPFRKNDHKTPKTTETKKTLPRPKKFLYQRPDRIFGKFFVCHQCTSIVEPIRSMARKTPEPAPTWLEAVDAVQTDKAFEAVVAESLDARLRSTSRGRQWPMTWQPYHVVHILGCASTQTAVVA